MKSSDFHNVGRHKFEWMRPFAAKVSRWLSPTEQYRQGHEG
jgi:hypothetical protein